ncbi:pseudouridine synthase [Teratosphaeria nubilosa]|uniref:tRNA pseudouridine synthase 1 n=1 Tax=Teratosphaeria nubilosa TaxID=161662 RepID=A0A6G1L0X7_9PEZI|nr:pseudouridine synthase [Teratosphaeria nubilosa]
MEDASKAVEPQAETGESKPLNYDQERKQHDQQRTGGKRKGDWGDKRQQFGSKGGRNDNRRHKKGDMGRSDYYATNPDKRQKTDDSRREREKNGNAKTYGVEFSQEEIDAEGRKPKRKVAVLIGYSGSGYKGMQITPNEKTIEGDLFTAFVKAGAISKANADDPKKAGLVRCARTDKGVHAAGNMISLKLIVEEPDIVQKINEQLSPQIRVWGIERTIGSFSCYQACDSRWYEYLIPSYAFLPPHPSSFLAKQLEALADEAGDRESYDARQEEVKGFWELVDEEQIKPILETIDEDIRWEVVKALQGEEEASAKAAKADADVEQNIKAGKSVKNDSGSKRDDVAEKTEEAAIIINEPAVAKPTETDETAAAAAPDEEPAVVVESIVDSGDILPPHEAHSEKTAATSSLTSEEIERNRRLKEAAKRLRAAYNTAKRRYRIPQKRIDRIQNALSRYEGTKNYHNYTIQKTFRDPSAKRHIKSFRVKREPILIGDGPDDEKTEWLSLKVHGQSFMMHQIRKMVGMVSLLVRCGSNLGTMERSMGEDKYSIPKVPGLGLLLERPVFDSYNTLTAPKHNRDPLEFFKYETELEEFKGREIYQRIFREEEEKNEFARFYNHIDNFREPYFLYVTSKGIEATRLGEKREKEVKGENVAKDTGLGAAEGEQS